MGILGLFTKLEVGMKLHEVEAEAARQKRNAYDDGLAQGRLEGKSEQEAKDNDRISGFKAAVTRYANLAKRVKEMEKIAADHHFIFGDEVEHKPVNCLSSAQPLIIDDGPVIFQTPYTSPDVLGPYIDAVSSVLPIVHHEFINPPCVELSHETAYPNNLTS